MASQNKQSRYMCSLLLALAVISCVLIGNTMAGGKGKGEDIILYNGNIILRGGKGKGKGGSIVVANSPSSSHEMPYMDFTSMFGRRK